jgi:hypothetical protein
MGIKMDHFLSEYLDAIEFTDCTSDNPELCDADGFSDALIAEAKLDCAAFQEANADDLAIYQEIVGYSGAVDFWLTRNQHGAGFWDRGLGEVGERLTEAAHAFGPCETYVGDDNLIYC